jgi:hypothetical protein
MQISHGESTFRREEIVSKKKVYLFRVFLNRIDLLINVVLLMYVLDEDHSHSLDVSQCKWPLRQMSEKLWSIFLFWKEGDDSFFEDKAF